MEIDRNWCPKESEGCKVPGGGGDSAANGTCWIGWSNDWNASAATCRPADGWVGGTRRVPQRKVTHASLQLLLTSRSFLTGCFVVG